MELWVRSQDKKNLIKIDNLYIEETAFSKNDSIWGTIFCNSGIELGLYLKDRALEVLDEITKRKDELDKSYFLGMEEASFVSSIYEMPEE